MITNQHAERLRNSAAATRPLPRLGDRHCLIVGGTRRGKSGATQLIFRETLSAPDIEGVTLIDSCGGSPRDAMDWIANPANGQHNRPTHVLKTTGSHTTGLNILWVEDPTSWDQCHAAASALTGVIEAHFKASAEATPRLARLIYVACMICARKRLTLIEALEVLSLGGHHIRDTLLSDCDNHIIRRELEDLITLAKTSKREFLQLIESTHNRLARWLTAPSLWRILGQTRGLDVPRVIEEGHVVLADFSTAPPPDAALLACIMNEMYFLAARKRPPLKGRRHRLILEEAESSMTVTTARTTDQSAKFGLLLIAVIQRLGQARKRDDDLLEALMVNTGCKIIFGGLESESARYMCENVFANFIDLEEWKLSTIRPTVVGNDLITLHGRTAGQHHSEQSAEAISDMHSTSRVRGTADAAVLGWGSVFSAGNTTNAAMLPDGGMLTPPTPLTNTTGRNIAVARSAAGARSKVRTAAEQDADAHGRSAIRGRANGTVDIASENESVIARFEDLPQQQFSLEEQLTKATWLLQSLPRRSCVVRIEDEAPVTMRTADLSPAFKSEHYKQIVLPLYMHHINTRSAYMRPNDEIDAEIEARLAALTSPPEAVEPDFSEPEPAPKKLRVVGDK